MNPLRARPDPDKCKLMSFGRIWVGANVDRLVDELAVEISAGEQRGRRRSDAVLVAFKDTLRRALGDFAKTLADGKGHYRTWPKGSNHYSQPYVLVPYRQAMAVYEGLKRLGYIKTVRRGWFDADAGDGSCELVEPTDALHERLRQAGVMDDLPVRWTFDPRIKEAARHQTLILVRRKRKQPDGTRLPADLIPGLELTEDGRRLVEQMELRAQFIQAQEITGAQLIGWNRIFVQDLTQGGRMYALPRGESSYQQMKKEERPNLLINGMPVREIDPRAASLYFALSCRGISLVERLREMGNDDPYALPDPDQRDIIKHYWTVCGGSEEHPRWWPKGTTAKLKLDRLPKIAEVREVFLQAYPELMEMRDIGWPRLYKLESDAIGMAMDLLRAQNIPALPVHDSLIVPVRATELAIACLKHACTEVAGFPPVEPKVTPGADNLVHREELDAAAVA